MHTLYLVLLSFGAYWDDFLIFEAGASHSALILLLLKSAHNLVLFDSTEVVLVSDAGIGVNPRLRDCLGLPNLVEVGSGPRALLLTKIAVSWLLENNCANLTFNLPVWMRYLYEQQLVRQPWRQFVGCKLGCSNGKYQLPMMKAQQLS